MMNAKKRQVQFGLMVRLLCLWRCYQAARERVTDERRRAPLTSPYRARVGADMLLLPNQLESPRPVVGR